MVKRSQAFELKFFGASIEEICLAIEANPATVSSYFSREWRDAYKDFSFQRVSEMHREVTRRLSIMGEQSLVVLDDVLKRGSNQQKFNAAKYVLDKVIIKDLKELSTPINPIREMLIKFKIWDEDGNIIPDPRWADEDNDVGAKDDD